MNLRDIARRTGYIAMAAMVSSGFLLPAGSEALASTGSWTRSTVGTPVPTTGALTSIAYGAGIWVAAEHNGNIDTSTDGVNWTHVASQIDSGYTQLFDGVVYGSEFVIVGQNGEIDTSTDGTHWTKQTSNTSNELYSIAYGNGTYVAVGYNGTVDASSNGTSWATHTVSGAGFEAVTYGNGQFVAACDGGAVYTSPDGATWTAHSAGVTAGLWGITYGGGMFVAVGTGGTIVHSTDGVSWQSATSGTSNDLNGVAYGAGKFVAVGSTSATATNILSSTDGTTWSAESASTVSSDFLDCITYANSRFVAGGQNYTATAGIVQTQSTNANLSGLALDAASLSPSFSPGTFSYSASVAHTVSSIKVTPTLADSAATMTVNGSVATSGTAVSVPLSVGGNPINVVVTAQSGGTKAYTITVTRAAASTNANLSSLTVDQGTLSPAFASGTFSYTDSVGYTVSSLNVTPTLADGTATMTVDGSAATSGSAVPVNLTVGSNTITVVVTAQDGTTQKTYTITVTRAAASTNASLSNLVVDQGTLSPAFASGTTSYTDSVGYTKTSLNVTPTLADGTATMTVDGSAATSGAAVYVPLNVGSNTITVVVTAQDGTTQLTYTITVTRAAASTNANLNNLAVDQGTLSPTFASGTTSYTGSVGYTTTSLNMTPTLADTTATMTVDGSAATSGAAVYVPLNVGSNTITVVVTAQDGTTQKTYTITVTRASASTNASLSNLTVDQGTLSPAFASGTFSYTDSVPYTTTSLNMTPTLAGGTATMTVGGTAATSGAAVYVPLTVGSNTITVVVTAQDGTTQKTYTITVTRAAASTNANLGNLTLDQGTLSPTFASGTTSYTDSVPYTTTSLNVTPTLADTTATMTVDGSAATSGAAVYVPLTVGSNTITVVVTAQDGTTQLTYTITVTRAAASTNANLNNLMVDQGTLSPTFASGTTSYTDSVGYTVSSLNVTPTLADGTATMTVDGTAATTGAAVYVPLNVGSNTITVVVTAQDGTTQKTYTITVTRAAASTNANLSNLMVDQGNLTPTFASGTSSYTDGVGYTITRLNVTPILADTTATVTVDGSPAMSGTAVSVPLTVGSNTITVVVTAQDGLTQQTYTITVTRASASTWGNSGFPTVIFSEALFRTGVSFEQALGDATVQVNVPNGTFSQTVQFTLTTENVQTLSDTLGTLASASREQPVIALGVNFSGATPNEPITITITSPSIPANAVVYKWVGGTLVPVQAVVTQGKMVITFTSDPDFVVMAPKLTWGTSWLPAWVNGHSVDETLQVTGGSGPYTWSIASGDLPTGVVLNSATGVLSGTAIGSGRGTVVIQVTDASGYAVKQTLSWDVIQPYEREILLNGQSTNVPGLVRNDGDIPTTYMPMWYVMQVLKSLGITSTWNGHDWALTASGVGSVSVVKVGRGDTGVYVNGVVVERMTRVVAQDPNSKRPTTYIPIWYMMQVMNQLHLHTVWNGTTWVITTNASNV